MPDQTPNTWAAELMPRIIADSRLYLRRQATWLTILNHDFSSASGRIGQKVDVPIPVDSGVQDLQAAQLPPVATGKSFATTQIVLDNAKISDPFTVEQIHLQNYQISGPNSVLQQQINSQIDAVIGAMATNLWTKYKNIPTFVGVGGTDFFTVGGSPSINRLNSVHSALFAQRVPEDRPKYGIMSYKDWESMGNVQEVRQAYSIGTPEVIQNYNWPSIMGLGLKRDFFAPIHTAGTIGAGGLSISANTVAGVESVSMTNGANATALKAGDIVVVTTGGTPRQYSLQQDLSLGANAVDVAYLDRGLDANVVLGDAVTLATNFASGRQLIFGDMLGVGLVTRLPENPKEIPEMPIKIAGDHYPITDPVSGVTVLLSFFGQFFQRTMLTSLVWGAKITHPARLVRGLSANA
jgi:hypothetical protein